MPLLTSTAAPVATAASPVAATIATTSAATVANHLLELRVDVLLGLLEHVYKITRLLGICSSRGQLSVQNERGSSRKTYCQW